MVAAAFTSCTTIKSSWFTAQEQDINHVGELRLTTGPKVLAHPAWSSSQEAVESDNKKVRIHPAER